MLDAQKNKGRHLPYLRNPNVRWFDVDTTELQTMPFEEHEDERYGLKAGDIVICEGGEAGRAAIWDGRLPDLKFQKAIHRVRPGPKLCNRYFVHQLMADYASGRLADYYTGATIKHLTGQDLARYEFPLPPLGEQQRIATILDKADALRAKRRATLAQLDTLTRSIFLDMFGDPATNPKKWQVKRISDVLNQAEIFTDGDWVESKDQDPAGEVRLIQLADIGDGQYLDKSARFLTSQTAIRLKCTFLNAGDVLLARMPDPLGRACIFPGDVREAVTVVDVCIIRPAVHGPEPIWLAHAINTAGFRGLISREATGTTRERISRGNLSKLRLIVPPRDLQVEFCRIDAEVERQKAMHKRNWKALDDLFASLQHRAFRGEL